MTSGLSILHNIDAAIAKARRELTSVAAMPEQSAKALGDIERQRVDAFNEIASQRLELIEHGGGGELGYVDRQAEKLLMEHGQSLVDMRHRIETSVSELEDLEAKRRQQEKKVEKAIDAYDKRAATAEAKLITQPDYAHHLRAVETAEAKVVKASEKLELAREDEAEKAAPYKADPFFSYLQSRHYGTDRAKGWFLTKGLDRWVARLVNYAENAKHYDRLIALPLRLNAHVESLKEKANEEKSRLEQIESEFLESEGVTGLLRKSIEAQKELEQLDTKIETSEAAHQTLRDAQIKLSAGNSGPYRQAVELMSASLSRLDERKLKLLASQTRAQDDDQAVDRLRLLMKERRELEDEQSDAQRLLTKIQNTLRELERVRRRYKDNRYDAPSSVFNSGSILEALLGQVLTGALTGDDFWKSIVKAQRTVRRYSDNDFGGIDWTEGLRLPRSSGGWGGTYPRRTSIPRMPRQNLPKITIPRRGAVRSGSRRGGFRTGGGF